MERWSSSKTEGVKMVYTSYFGKMSKFPKNYIPVAICGGIPHWYNGAWYKAPAPKIGFFQEWKKNQDNNYYIQHYKEEVLDKLNISKVIIDIHMMVPEEIRAVMKDSIWKSPDFHVVLLCYEKTGDFCHRHLFANWLHDTAGLEVTEWKC